MKDTARVWCSLLLNGPMTGNNANIVLNFPLGSRRMRIRVSRASIHGKQTISWGNTRLLPLPALLLCSPHLPQRGIFHSLGPQWLPHLWLVFSPSVKFYLPPVVWRILHHSTPISVLGNISGHSLPKKPPPDHHTNAHFEYSLSCLPATS